MSEQPEHSRRAIGGSNFIYGPRPGGFGAQLYIEPDGTVSGIITLGGEKEGPPGHAHGGALATMIDEAMGAAAWHNGYRVLAAHLNFNYRKPAPLGVELQVRGRIVRIEGRKVFTSGEVLLPDGSVATEGTGLFINAPQYFDEFSHPFGSVREGDEGNE